jgi:hypothetical protein
MPEKIRFFMLFCEGSEYATFIEMLGTRSIAVMWAFTNKEGRVTHQTLYEQAIEQGYIKGKKDPVGGGVVDMVTFEVSSSINYGPASNETEERFVNYLRKRNFHNPCR